MTTNSLYNYSGTIQPVGVAKAEPIIQNFLAIQAAFSNLDLDSIDRLLELLRDIFPSLQDGGAIFTKYWPVVTEPVTYSLDMVEYGTHIIPIGAGGDCQIAYSAWPSEGTKFATVIFLNAGLGIVRWPVVQKWQTRGEIPPILKNNGFDTIAIWRDADLLSVLGQDIILSARAGR